MAKNLKLFSFNNFANSASSSSGWIVASGIVVNSLAGDDRIVGSSVLNDFYGFGIKNLGTIVTGTGNDILTGATNGYADVSSGIINRGTISTGIGNDIVSGSGKLTVLEPAINNSGRIDTADGDDIITGDASAGIGASIYGGDPYTGIVNSGIITTGIGNDRITGIGKGRYTYGSEASRGYGICNSGQIYTNYGADIVLGSGGLKNDGVINTGADNDTLQVTFAERGHPRDLLNSAKGRIDTGIGNDTLRSSVGVGNSGSILLGDGDDRILGSDYGQGTGETGIGNFSEFSSPVIGTINTGDGNDTIDGRGSGTGISNTENIFTGVGNDLIVGIGTNFTGISNTRYSARDPVINTGSGNDTIIGECISPAPNLTNVGGIENEGVINTGDGMDTVTALKGGFVGGGAIDLGADNDSLKGFAKSYYGSSGPQPWGNFYGGTGIDKILFGVGTYRVSGATISKVGYGEMNVSGFEQIGGANGGLFSLINGMSISINSAGIAVIA